MKPGLSESQAEAEELNQSQSVGTSIVIGLSSRSCFRLPSPTEQSGFHKIISEEVISGFGIKTETFEFFRLRFCCAYRSAYDSDFWFWLSLKRFYDSYSDFAAVSFITVFFPYPLLYWSFSNVLYQALQFTVFLVHTYIHILYLNTIWFKVQSLWGRVKMLNSCLTLLKYILMFFCNFRLMMTA